MKKEDKEIFISCMLTILLLLIIVFNTVKIVSTQSDYKEEVTILKENITILNQENEDLRIALLEYEEKYNELLSESCIKKQELIEPLKIYNLKEYYLLYKEIEKEYSGDFGRPLSIYDIYTEEDILYIQRCVETETYGCPFENKVNVANVILNRVSSDRFADTPKGVVTSPSQFAYFRTKISEDTVLAVEYAFMFEDTTDGALFFHSGKYSDTFSGAKYIFTDSSGHKFYK